MSLILFILFFFFYVHWWCLQGNWKIAFIMVNLHFHKLIERSLLGSRFWYKTLNGHYGSLIH